MKRGLVILLKFTRETDHRHPYLRGVSNDVRLRLPTGVLPGTSGSRRGRRSPRRIESVTVK